MKMAFLLAFAVAALPSLDAEASSEPAKEMAPYVVEESPFGFLGIKHATLSLSPVRLITGRKSIRYLQIDELEPDSPGVAAGVKKGDRVTRIDNVPITDFGIHQLKHFGETVEPGQKLIVSITRPTDGSVRTVVVVVAKSRPHSGTTADAR